MKLRAVILALFIAAIGLTIRAQNTTTYGTITKPASTCTPTSCVFYQVTPGMAWVSIGISGTWSGTLQVQAIDSPTATYQNLNSQTWSLVSTITGNGTTAIATGTARFILVNAPTLASGSVSVQMSSSVSGTPLSNAALRGLTVSNGLQAPNGGSSSNCWATDGSAQPCSGGGVTPPNATLLGGTGTAFQPVIAGSGLNYDSASHILTSTGSASNPAGPAFAVNFANSGVNAFQGDPNITINPTTHVFQALNINGVFDAGATQATIQAAIGNASNGGTVQLRPNTTIALSSPLTISSLTGVTITGSVGSVIQAAANLDALDITNSTQIKIEKVTLSGSGTTGGYGLSIVGSTHVEVSGVYNAGFYGEGVYISGDNDVNIHDSPYMNSTFGDTIHITGSNDQISIVDNVLDCSLNTISNHKCISAHTDTAGSTLTRMVESGNRMTCAVTFCSEYGGFTGNIPDGVTVTNEVGNIMPTTLSRTLTITGVTAAVAGSSTYSLTLLPYQVNRYPGESVTITACSQAANNGTFTVTSATSTSLTIPNGSAVAESDTSCRVDNYYIAGGGWSFSGVNNLTVSNIVYNNYTGQQSGLAALELVDGARNNVTNFVANGGFLSIDKNFYTSVIGSRFNNWFGTTALHLSTSVTGLDTNHVNLLGNYFNNTGWDGTTVWVANSPMAQYGNVLKDSNNNLQVMVKIGCGTVCFTGATQPTWNTTYGGFTTESDVSPSIIYQNIGPYGGPSPYPILWIQCNAVADCSDINITGNTIQGDGTTVSGVFGFTAANGIGTMANLTFNSNNFQNVKNCYSVAGATNGLVALNNDQACASLGNVAVSAGTLYVGATTLPVANSQHRNLAPDSDLKYGTTYWSPNSGSTMAIAHGVGGGGGNAFVYTGTGSVATSNQKSVPIPVIPGNRYTVSAYIDATNVTVCGSPCPGIQVWNTLGTVDYGNAYTSAGAAGTRASVGVTIPSGVTSVVLIANTGGATVSSGNPFIISDVMFEAGSSAHAYVANTMDELTGTILPGALPLASSSAFGAAKCDGTTITCSGGVFLATGGGSSGISGLTTGQVGIAGSATTLTGSIQINGAGGGLVSGPTSAPAADIPVFTGTAGAIVDSGVALSSLAPKASPAFTGTPTAPTATVGTNTTQIATTAFVLANAGSGGGNTTSTSLTANLLPKANGANSIVNSAAGDDGTTFTYSGTGGLSATAGPVSSASDGVHAGNASIVGNTTPAVLAANTFNFMGPNVATFTSLAMQAPSTLGVGLLHFGTPTSSVYPWTSSLVAIADLSASGTPSGTTFLRGDNTWATPSTAASLWSGLVAEIKANGSTTFSGVGDNLGNATSSTASSIAASVTAPIQLNSVSAAILGDSAGWSGAAIYYQSRLPSVTWYGSYSASTDYTTTGRIWMGLYSLNTSSCNSATMAASDNPACSTAAIRYSTVAGDSVYQCVTSTAVGAAQTVTPMTGAAPTASLTKFNITINSGSVTCTVGSVTVTNTTNLTASNPLAFLDYNTSETATTAVNIRLAGILGVSNSGVF